MAAAEVVVVVAVISHAAIVVVLAEVDTAGAAVVEVAAEDLLEVVSVDLHLVLTIECLAMVKILTKIINERPKKELKDSSKLEKRMLLNSLTEYFCRPYGTRLFSIFCSQFF